MVDYENSGILFKNDKRDNEKAPDYTGKLNVGGTDYRLAAWIKEGQRGKFMTLSVSDVDRTPAPAPETKPLTDDLDDEIPF